MRLKYFTIVAIAGCCCRFFISVGLFILLAATVLIIMDGTNLYMFISIAHKTQCLWVCRWIPLNGYGTLLIFEMMWYATVSNWAHMFTQMLCHINISFCLVSACFSTIQPVAQVFSVTWNDSFATIFVNMIEYFWNSERMTINSWTNKKK